MECVALDVMMAIGFDDHSKAGDKIRPWRTGVAVTTELVSWAGAPSSEEMCPSMPVLKSNSGKCPITHMSFSVGKKKGGNAIFCRSLSS